MRQAQGITEYFERRTLEYMAGADRDGRKRRGQFFTGRETARFMAELFTPGKLRGRLEVLDPGAGTGMLSAALLERLPGLAAVESVSLVCWENDPAVLPLLRGNLRWLERRAEGRMRWRLLEENYLVSQREEYAGLRGTRGRFDLAIVNPPWKKTGRNAPEALAMPDVCHGAPNLSFLFAAMSSFNLKPEGELVCIMPRSWTSGRYFARFRRKFLAENRLERLHLFESRDKVFEREKVLQETVILKAVRTEKGGGSVIVSRSRGGRDSRNGTEFSVPAGIAVHGEERQVFPVSCAEDLKVIRRVRAMKATLPELGVRMTTGVTVGFRNRDALRGGREAGAVPLLLPRHVREGTVRFPLGIEGEYLVTDRPALLQKNEDCLLVRRFTAGEEKRRLQCALWFSARFPECSRISTDNKLNVVRGEEKLPESLLSGLYVIFNSGLYDAYYRLLNGSTQVNASECNQLPVPEREVVEAMGRELMAGESRSTEVCDAILERHCPP